mgnify:CR=1 FL=1
MVAPAWIGDAVLSQPMLALLGERFPDSGIDVLAAPWVAPVFKRMAQVRQVVVSPFAHGELRLASRRQLAETLPPYGRAIVLPNSLKSALVPWFAGIPVRTGWRGEMRFGLLNDLRELDELPMLRPGDETGREADVNLTFGQAVEAPRRSRAAIFIGLALLLLAAAILAGGWAWMIVSKDPGVPPLPEAPRLKIGQPPPPVPLPTEEDIQSSSHLIIDDR